MPQITGFKQMAETQKKEEQQGSKKGLIVAFIIILLAINAIQLYFNLTQNSKISEQGTKIENQNSEIKDLTAKITAAQQELEQRKNEIAQLGGDTTRLSEQIRALEQEKIKLQKENRVTYAKFMAVQKEIDNAKSIKDWADKEITRYQALVEEQGKQIQEYKTTIVSREDSIKKLAVTTQELSQKVAIASILRAENIKIESVSHKGKVKVGEEFKSKTIEKLHISFKLGKNDIAKKEGKEIYLRVVEPNGSTIFDQSTGGGSFSAEGKELSYTSKQEVLFDNNNTPVSFMYVKGSPYRVGKHHVEIYCEGVKIGEGHFLVK